VALLEDAQGCCFYRHEVVEGLGVDRVAAGPDSSYEHGNVVPCCGDCNLLKGSMDLLSWRKCMRVTAEGVRAGAQRIAAKAQEVGKPTVVARFGTLAQERRELEEEQPELFEMGAVLRGSRIRQRMGNWCMAQLPVALCAL
jgi:hypothetical protein